MTTTVTDEQVRKGATAAQLLFGTAMPDMTDWSRRGTTPPAGEQRMLIGGELRGAKSGRLYETLNPATEQVNGAAADCSPDDVLDAIAAARQAFDSTGWSLDAAFRAHCLGQLVEALTAAKEDLRAATIAEVGCTLTSTYALQIEASIGLVAYVADLVGNYPFEKDLPDSVWHPGAHRVVVADPVGVVGAIAPWNFPLFLAVSKIAPALGAGCTVVHKAAPGTPWSGGTLLGRLIAEATDIPPGVVNILTSSDPAVGEVLSTDPRVDMVTFTGSTAVGRKLMANAAGTVKNVTLELGGKSANIVLPDADFNDVIPRAAGMVCFNAGQACALATRLLVPAARYEEALDIAAEVYGALSVGDPLDPATAVGPVQSRRQLERVLGYIEAGQAEGARVVTGGGSPPKMETGYFIEPTVLADVAPDMKVFQEEIFGPVVTVTPYDTDEEAVALANATIYGLSGAVWGGDVDRAKSVAKRIRTGTVAINGMNPFGLDGLHGGQKQSGIGREWGVVGFEEFLEPKLIAD